MDNERQQVEITGLVQGVGFRPFVYRLANECKLDGWVANHSGGVRIEVEGDPQIIAKFLRRLAQEKPSHSQIFSIHTKLMPMQGDGGFEIRESTANSQKSTLILPDLAPCDHCLAELADPGNRRHNYPFINCTLCGPRFSIIDTLPYDRANTTMSEFALCEECRKEYTTPSDRRFHAEPNACPQCGPELQLTSREGNTLAVNNEALDSALAAISKGQVVALKGVGGFQLLVDAADGQALEQLRKRKHRPHKPFALLYSSLEAVRRDCQISKLESVLLVSRERPIVLLEAKAEARHRVHSLVAPDSPELGVMLPASPLHQLLTQKYGAPLVATSGNLAEEPICIENNEALERLGKIADCFLIHNRQILRPLDDSVLRVIENRPLMLRRARGFAPLPLVRPQITQENTENNRTYLALGADLKNTVALSRSGWIYSSQHIGDLGNATSVERFDQAIEELTSFQQCEPQTLIHDLHPGYTSHRWAQKKSAAKLGVQHHTAHFFSCMAEHNYVGSALGICWDGTGYDSSGVVRGGEFLHWNGASTVKRIASLRTFPLPGGEKAVREPRRAAAGLLFEISGFVALQHDLLKRCFSRSERRNLVTMLKGEINSPQCSSAGRLFDAVAALLGLSSHISYEGQAAMAIEHSARGIQSPDAYPFDLQRRGNQWQLDWAPSVSALIYDEERSLPQRAAVFHNTLAQMILSVAIEVGESQVFLSGGVFQNKRLTETVAKLLRQNNFTVHCHSLVPPNDGGIALGQVYYAHCMAAAGQPLGG
ncbi:carbamoyltransferase HypF [Microbulbifer sp. GL-2]|uniref:carbamoyltransferase HypF n=1 Tax=Microbulbifer sp. GL-2 TaxID=2591606 RepID=UPI001163CE59|nr:carbamoyltransferase HypF [Microbulbifer sp. GL-2]BBM03499.1 carbamoyltransferase [Microbulbifer sp. GL-2]